MTPTLPHIYTFRYNVHLTELYRLEARQVFGEEVKGKFLFSDKKIDPSISPFIKSRFDIQLTSSNYSDLLQKIEQENIHKEGFKVEYLKLPEDETGYQERLQQLRDIGHCIHGEPDYDSPTRTYAICYYEDTHYFGVLIKHKSDWQKHKQKPRSFSNSINMDIAKTLVSIATKGDKNTNLLDACCGVGTVLLEACVAGFQIEGCDINWSACKHSRENLEYFNYSAQVYCSDVKDLEKQYGASIIDLPYNLYSYSNDDIAFKIIASAAKLSHRIVIVSIADIKSIISKAGLEVIDFCKVDKPGKGKFQRSIWICQRN